MALLKLASKELASPFGHPWQVCGASWGFQTGDDLQLCLQGLNITGDFFCFYPLSPTAKLQF